MSLTFLIPLLNEAQEVLAILVFEHGLSEVAEFVCGDPAVVVGDVFEAGDLEAGAFFHHLHENGGLGEGVVGAGIEPGEAAAEGLDLEFAVGQEGLVDARDLQFAAGGGLDALGDVNHLVGVEVEADDGVVALGVGGFLFDAEAVAVFVEFGDAVAFGVGDPVAEDGGLRGMRCPIAVGHDGSRVGHDVGGAGHDGFYVTPDLIGGLALGGSNCRFQHRGKAGAVEDIVAQDEADGVVADEVFADEEGLREAIRGGLLGVFEVDAVVGAVAQEALEARQVLRGADDQDVPDTRQHQHADGVVDHRLVVDGQQLFADALGDRVETGAGAAGEDDAFHIFSK